MPGIVGLVSKMPRERAEAQLSKMVMALQHEPSYVTGTFTDERLGIYVGWVARKGSFDERMPLQNEEGDSILVFSGEEYSDRETIQRLKSQSHQFGHGDASYLVHAAEEDREFPRSLNGRFHGILINKREATAKLFIDRFGMHRLYTHVEHDAVYFAAEAKAILAVLPQLRQVDLQSLGEFVSCGCVLDNRSLFRDITLLPAASRWVFQNGELKSKEKYFSPSEWEGQSKLDDDAYYEELRGVFSRCLPRYFDGPQRVGLSVTGGLDTRMILAWAREFPQPIPTYTFVGPYRECKDVTVGRKVAETCQLPHQVIKVGEEFLSRFPQYAERAVFLTDACVGVNRGADLYVNEIAAKIAPVRMTGNYGSEILRHLRAFKPSDPASGLFQPELTASIEQAKATYKNLFQGHAVSFTAFRQAPWYQYGLLALEQTQLSVRSPFLDNDLVRTAFRAKNSEVVKSDLFEDNDACSRLIKDGSSALSRIPTDRGLGGKGGIAQSLLRAYLEFTFKAEYAYDYGMPPWLARIDHSLSALHLERAFLGRHKFCHFRVWYRDALSNYVKEILLDSKSLSRPYIQRSTLERMVQDHVKGVQNHTSEITKLLTLELTHRLFLS
jgi:asparagine synthase (glutamine-hydrolysing)